MSRLRAVVLFPPPSDLAAVLLLRERFDPQARLVGPHVTLVFPFDDALSSELLRAQVEEASRGVSPLTLRLERFGGSEGQYLFLHVARGADEVVALHDRLYTGPLARHLSPSYPYVPHLTVGRLASPDDLEGALAVASATPVSIETRCHAISICRQQPDRIWAVESEVPLGHD